MCVEPKRSALFSRASFLAAAGAAAAPILCHADVSKHGRGIEPLSIPSGVTGANRRAAEIAQQSPFIQARYAQVLDLVHSIGDAKLRANVLDLIEHPEPRYARNYPTLVSRTALRDKLAAAGFVKSTDSVSGIFPRGTENERIVQPFWSAPGSDLNSHHSYPGGLLVHELFNSSMAANFCQTYDAMYFDGASRVNRDVVIAAQLY